MNILVTGCAGFIGSHLCRQLLAEGHLICGIDALTDYYDPALKRANLEALMARREFRFLQIPVLEIPRPEVKRADAIFHLAAQPGVRNSWGAGFEGYVLHNVSSTQHLLQLGLEEGSLSKFVYASSSSVYGNTHAGTVPEDHPKNPFSPYGVTKLAGEQLCAAYNANFGLPTVSLRFFTVYGPGQRPDMAFHRLLRAALTGAAFPMYGDGAQQRDFTYVGDIVQALTLAAFSRAAGAVFNVGGGRVISMCDVVDLIERLSGKRVRLERHPSQPGDVNRTSADTTLIRSTLGYRPAWSLERGLELQLESLRHQLLARSAA